MSIGWILFLSAIALIVILVGSSWYMAAMMNIIFLRKHIEIDEVLTNGRPPEAWQKRYQKKLVHFKNKGASDISIMRLARKQQKHNIAGLARLASYVRKTHLVEDENARCSTLSQLDQCKRHCQLEGSNRNGI